MKHPVAEMFLAYLNVTGRQRKRMNGIIIKVLNYTEQFNENLLIPTLASVLLHVFCYYLLLFLNIGFIKNFSLLVKLHLKRQTC